MRRGFSLVEIVVALALALIVTGGIHTLVVSTHRLSRLQATQIDLQSNVRAMDIVLENELRELNAIENGSVDQTDILSAGSTGLMYRAMRGIGFLCQPAFAGEVRIARSTFSGFRDPQPTRDGVYLLVEGDPEHGAADSWLRLSIVSVATNVLCPGGDPAIALTVSPAPAVAPSAGTPVRVFETMETKLYQSGGQTWLGARSTGTGEVIQPIAGPLRAGDGLHLDYLNTAGAPTNSLSGTRGVMLTIRGTTEDPVFTPDGARLQETVVGQVTLRNGSH
jgi:prepilin-type N-terminal cleavage/methylation domain-containing protein